MIGIFKPAPHVEQVADDEVDDTYKRLRWQVYIGIFIGYAGYYLVRKNFSLAIPNLVEEGFSRTELGFALSGVAIAYGLSKFVMGSVSDRSNARYFMSFGLLTSALCMIFMGTSAFALSSVWIMFLILLLNGWVQGMGWPPSGRIMVHWFSPKERGRVVSFWNVAHNIGGGMVGILAVWGMAIFAGDYKSVFYFHGMIAIVIAIFIWLTVRDTPQSQGLPSIEKYHNDYPMAFKYKETHETEFSAKQIFMEYVLNNKLLWAIAVANAFVYLVRYGVLDWAPLYLQEAKDFTFDGSSFAYALYELAGIPGTIICGIISDKYFRARRAPALILFMGITLICVVVYWLNPIGNPSLDIAMLIAIGFFIYGPVMLIGLFALDLVPKKAAGTAAGFTGLFGYVGGAVSANVAIGYAVDIAGWDAGFMLIIGACVLSIVLASLTIKAEMKFNA
ncbi:glycerol-3-phosphate transporter [Pseudemcibacter aquimaris]|uniref:glycerol-3-phosphate transporter n=1 Tax=Pseudemcibacter aquimaris TaxID=2857064 RepID=UPI002012030A|nr:glycerol-3-phosphate transporter [Pseudemcibacter aquimaris]MCC3859749.1 glycerol-3-phosphate transporter [Pseudemcibacter aquimaris]WDU60143.1 glycerol-3-phosphate transporter [Pseudemcibacter aquimaris]